MPQPTNNDPGEPALGSMLVLGGSIETYVDGTTRSGLHDASPRGMVLHWACQLAEGTLTGTLWRERALAERFMADVLADAFTEIVGSDHERDRASPDFSYSMLSLVNFVTGADTGLAVGRKIGGAAGAVLVRPRADRGRIEYLAIAKSLGLDAAAPSGMLTHVAAADGETVRWIDLWLDRAAPLAFYEDGGIAAESLEVLPLHTVLASATELDQLPRFPHGEDHLHF